MMNTQAQEYAGVGSLRDWTRAIINGGSPSVIFHPGVASETLAIMEAALKLPKFFSSMNVNCSVSGSTNVVTKGFGVKAGKAEFRVMPVNELNKGVAETSREAYHALDLNAACMEVVKAAVEAGETYDRALAAIMGRESGYISARRNDLDKLGEFNYNGKKYRVEYTSKKPCQVTGRRVQWWRVVEVTAQPTLF